MPGAIVADRLERGRDRGDRLRGARRGGGGGGAGTGGGRAPGAAGGARRRRARVRRHDRAGLPGRPRPHRRRGHAAISTTCCSAAPWARRPGSPRRRRGRCVAVRLARFVASAARREPRGSAGFLADRLNDGFVPAVPREAASAAAGEVIPLGARLPDDLAGVGRVLTPDGGVEEDRSRGARGPRRGAVRAPGQGGGDIPAGGVAGRDRPRRGAGRRRRRAGRGGRAAAAPGGDPLLEDVLARFASVLSPGRR